MAIYCEIIKHFIFNNLGLLCLLVNLFTFVVIHFTKSLYFSFNLHFTVLTVFIISHCLLLSSFIHWSPGALFTFWKMHEWTFPVCPCRSQPPKAVDNLGINVRGSADCCSCLAGIMRSFAYERPS